MAITKRTGGDGRGSRYKGSNDGRGNKNTDIAEIIAQQLAALVPTIVTQVASALASGNRSRDNGGNNNGNRSGFKYKEFIACKPKEFDGKGGAVAYTRWMEKMEAVIDLSDCAADKRVRYVTGSLTDQALTWWNTQVQAKGREAALSMSWDDFKALMKGEFCPKNEMQRLENELWNHAMVGANHAAYTDRFHELAKLVPHLATPESQRIKRYIYGLVPQIRGMILATEPPTLRSAILKAGTLTDEMVRNGTLTRNSEKRKRFSESSKQRNARSCHKKARIGKTFTKAETGKKEYKGPHPKCNRCNYHHQPSVPCRVCARCNRLGHFAKDCRIEIRHVTPLNVVYPEACYKCGSSDHYHYECPDQTPRQDTNNSSQMLAIEGNNNQGDNARGRVFAMEVNETHQNANVVTSTSP